MMGGVTEDRTEEGSPVAAGLGRRLIARFVDGLLFAPLTLVIALTSGASRDDFSNGEYSLAASGVYLASFFYEALLTWRFGQTLGKRLLGIRVHDIVDARPPTLLRSVARVLVVTGPPPALVAIWLSADGERSLDLVWGLVLLGSVLLRPEGRGFHDLAARTRVVAA